MSHSYASWTFREAPKFFDIVTYTGNGIGGLRSFAHSLGIEPGMIIIKDTTSTNPWIIYHRNFPAGNNSEFNTGTTYANGYFSTAPTTSQFSINSTASTATTNVNGSTYVAYLFAHDPSADGIIQAGSFMWTGEVNLGWEPQYVLRKRINGTPDDWIINDTMRWWTRATDTTTDSKELYPNLSSAESGNMTGEAVPTATGFKHSVGTDEWIYLAIRKGPMKTPTDGTKVYSAIARTGNGTATNVTGVGFAPDFVIPRERGGYSATVFFDRLRGVGNPAKGFFAYSPDTESNFSGDVMSLDMDGGTLALGSGYTNTSGKNYINHFFRRAPGFFDQVAYTGNGVDGTNITHKLGVTPELMIVKSRNAAGDWSTYASSLGANWQLVLQQNWAKVASSGSDDVWNHTNPTTTQFTVGKYWNNSGSTYTAYLYATLPGISKVGSYTGDGTTGKVINAGFTGGAKYIMIKRTDSTGDWLVWDTARGIVAGNDPHISLNTTTAEVTSDDSVDPENSGFIINQNTATNINVSGGQYIYYAVSGDTTGTPPVSGATSYASQLYNFDATGFTDTGKITVSLLAYGTASAGNGITAKIWNNTAGQWETLTSLSNTEASMPTILSSQALTNNLSNYFNANQVKILVHTTNPSTDTTTAVLNTDLIKLGFGTNPNSPTLNNYNDNSNTTDTTPTLNFDLSDNDLGDLIKYQIQIDNNSNFSSPEIDFTEADFTASPRAGTTFTTTPLADGRYYWQVKAIDDEGLASAWGIASTGFTVDVELPTSKILYPQHNANLKNVDTIIGHSTDGTGVDFTRISIQDLTTGLYYDGTNFDETTETWLMTTPIADNATWTRWSYTAPTWEQLHSYTIRSRATDLAGNEEHTDAITFTYDLINGKTGSIYSSNPAVDNNSDYKIYYPNTAGVPLNGSIEIDFDNTFRFSPWLEDADIALSNQSSTITASSDTIDRVNKKITSTITAGNVGTNDLIELQVNNLRIHNPSASGSYILPIRIYNSVGGLIESGTGEIILVDSYQQVEVNVNIEQSLQVSVDSGAVLLEVDPDVQLGQNWDGTGGTVTEKTAVTVKTNAQSGYDLMIKLSGYTATGSAVLDGTTNTGNQITSTTGDRVTTENNFAFAVNSGATATGTNFTSTSANITGAGLGTPTNTHTDDIFYYLNVDYTTPSDVYRGTVTYTAVGQF